MSEEKPKLTGNTDELEDSLRELILFNDEVNTFDFVIETLITLGISESTELMKLKTIITVTIPTGVLIIHSTINM